MSKLKSHQLFYIQHHYETKTIEELATELEVEVKFVKAAVKRIQKERTVLEAASATPEPTTPKPETALKPKVADLPPPIPGQRPSTIVMNEGLSAQYDNFKPSPTASPRLKKCVAIVDENAPVY